MGKGPRPIRVRLAVSPTLLAFWCPGGSSRFPYTTKSPRHQQSRTRKTQLAIALKTGSGYVTYRLGFDFENSRSNVRAHLSNLNFK